MEKNINKNYTEVKLDGTVFDRNYRNPLSKAYQDEYALYLAVAELFLNVKCRSMCVETLKLYYRELPHSGRTAENGQGFPDSEKKHRTQEGLLSEMKSLAERDVAGNVNFPMMNACAAWVKTIPNSDGTHTFVFTDGIYGFSVNLEGKDGEHGKRIKVGAIPRPAL